MTSEIQTAFLFVKPDCKSPLIDKGRTLEIIAFLEDKLGGNFERPPGIRTGPVPKDFYYDFYDHLNPKYTKILEKMAAEFAGKSITVFIYKGPDIIDRIRKIAGPTRYKDNRGKETIRGVFGHAKMWYRTLVHASASPEDFENEYMIMQKYGLIPREYLEI